MSARMRASAGGPRDAILAVVGLALLPAAIAALSLHASASRRARRSDEPAIVAAVSRMPSADFAFAGGSRHLRTLSLEEPGAAFADGPGLPDPDPAGGVVSPPRAAWVDLPVHVAGARR